MGILEEFKRLTKPYPEEQTDAFEDFSNFSSKENKVRPAYDSAKADKVLSIHTTTQLQVVVVQPEHFESASDIANHLLERHTVVLNLEKANKEATRRLVDFLSGVVYAQNGKIKPVARSTYIITPSNIDVMGGELIGELESNGLYI
ncbi:MAG: cell division protein SepF [Oscillospiraceae bacterium]|jgi:cell division inhibitor SepF|nr:cell division protein SepF [Oscillospiraceae bacterium]